MSLDAIREALTTAFWEDEGTGLLHDEGRRSDEALVALSAVEEALDAARVALDAAEPELRRLAAIIDGRDEQAHLRAPHGQSSVRPHAAAGKVAAARSLIARVDAGAAKETTR